MGNRKCAPYDVALDFDLLDSLLDLVLAFYDQEALLNLLELAHVLHENDMDFFLILVDHVLHGLQLCNSGSQRKHGLLELQQFVVLVERAEVFHRLVDDHLRVRGHKLLVLR